MKKITFLLLSIFSISALNAQNIIVDKPHIPTIFQLSSSLSNISSFNPGFFQADRLFLNEETTLKELDFIGNLGGNQTSILPIFVSLNVHIYADNGGIPAGNPTTPGSEIIAVQVPLNQIGEIIETPDQPNGILNLITEFKSVKLTEANGGNQITLPSGSYWISIFIEINSDDFSDSWFWGWAESFENEDGSIPLRFNANNNLGWVESQFSNPPSMAFQLRGEPILSTANINFYKPSLSPNPAKDFITISKNNETLNQVLIYDVTGKKVLSLQQPTNKLNISELSKGIYILKMFTHSGRFNVMKFVKE